MVTNVPQAGAPITYADDDALPEQDDEGGVATMDQEQPSNPYDFDDGEDFAPAPAKPEAAEPADKTQETTAPKDESETAEEPAKQQEQPEIDSGLNDLLGRAEEYGFSKEDAAAMPPEVLLRAMATIDRQFAAMGRKSLESQQPQAEKPAEKAPAKPVEKAPEAQADESELRLSEELVDPELVKFSGNVADKFSKIEQRLLASEARAERLEAENAKLRQPVEQAQAREANDFTTKMDSFFDGLGDEYATVFGKGSIDKIPPALASARNEVVQTMIAIRKGRFDAGAKDLPFEEYRQRALHSLHPDKIKIQARKEVETKLAKHKKNSLAKPTSKFGKPQSRLEAAAATAERKFKELGIAAAMEDDGEV